MQGCLQTVVTVQRKDLAVYVVSYLKATGGNLKSTAAIPRQQARWPAKAQVEPSAGKGGAKRTLKRRQLLAKTLPGAGISQPKPRSSPAPAVCTPTAAPFGAAATGADRDAWRIHHRQIQVALLAKQKTARTGLLFKYPRT